MYIKELKMTNIKNLIINADDCGKSLEVNAAIKDAILHGKISSTTIMANMDDFSGAVELYKDYNSIISFGWHINLTEGHPLTYSQLLLDSGFYKEDEGKIVFNGKAFWYKFLNKSMVIEIKKELKAQYEKLCDNGIEVTHADSHHHIYTAPCLYFMMPSILNELHISRCRNIRNYDVSLLSYAARRTWALPFKMSGIKMPNTFTSFAAYHKAPRLRQGKIIELECHPGHPNEIYKKEMEMIYSTDIKEWNAQLISYKDF